MTSPVNIYNHARNHRYTDEAHEVFARLDQRVRSVFSDVQSWDGWSLIQSPSTSSDLVLGLVREIYRSVCWYQPHTTEAAFHMIGRLPKSEVNLMRVLAAHKAEEAEHGLWAREDLAKMGRADAGATSPAAFAVASVWWRMAQHEEPLGYLGAEYLYEQLTALATQAALPVIEQRDLPRDELRFVIEHATEDQKHATFLKHHILDVVSRYPESGVAMNRCFDYFHHVWPLPVWRECLQRARDCT